MSDTNSSRPFGIVAAALSQSGTSARVPRTRRLAKKGKFFEMCQVTLSSPGGYEIVNEAALFPQGGGERPSIRQTASVAFASMRRRRFSVSTPGLAAKSKALRKSTTTG